MDDTDKIGDPPSSFPMTRAWLTAAADLDIRFVFPFSFWFRGRNYVCTGLLPDFGGARGALVCSPSDQAPGDLFEVADEMGFYASGLNPHQYETYDREAFMLTLNDWGWYGDADKKPP